MPGPVLEVVGTQALMLRSLVQDERNEMKIEETSAEGGAR